jgi:hypothetical protein
MSPGVVRAAVRDPNMSPNDVDTGRLVSFARSGTTGSRCRDRSVMPSAPDLRRCRRADSIRQATHIQEPDRANRPQWPADCQHVFRSDPHRRFERSARREA